MINTEQILFKPEDSILISKSSDSSKNIRCAPPECNSFKSFENQVIGDEKIFKDGNKNLLIRETNAYKEAKIKCHYLARGMAIKVVSDSIDVYFRKFIKPDNITKRLFDNSDSFEHDKIIAWISQKLSRSALVVEKKFDLKLIPGDEVYHYKSPDFSWEMEFGREGYAVFRNNKLISNVVITMN